jgi:uncharacterized protein (DUF427 family)
VTSASSGWRHVGRDRPPFAVEPGPGQESVWDYPRPPRLEPDARHVVVRAGATVLAATTRAVRVLETGSPPTFYLPPDDVRREYLTAAPGTSMCEWKGRASYWTVVTPEGRWEHAGWSYLDPVPAFSAVRGYVSFYPGRVECTVEGEIVRPQPGGFYGGWITREIVGPWKGEPGTGAW